jgi:hypothetical protein
VFPAFGGAGIAWGVRGTDVDRLGLGFGLQPLGERHRDHALAALDLHVAHPGHETEPVGFNPFRPSRRSPADYVMVAAALVVCAALVIWALAG